MIKDTRDYVADAWQAWNRFWFTPTDPATFSLIRLLAGGMLFYTHLVWSLDLQAFLGPNGWLSVDFIRQMQGEQWSVWSVFFWIEQPWAIWCVHIFALVVFFCLMVGLFSRSTAVLGFLLAVSYAQRISPGAFFGLDKLNCMFALYLMLGPCGARYSLDRIWRLRQGETNDAPASASANMAIRLIQLHLCIIYLFSGLAKLLGENWQAGTALWWAVANFEYQSLDATWLADWPMLIGLATHVTIFWELFYVGLMWNRFTRPISLWIAVIVHGGIALFMGMITFGLTMIFANLSFVAPSTVRRWVDPLAGRVASMLTGGK
ncbi:MAG: HTTM domain-containing protein [Planctomycetes bacterium]|nr:HTTM domain-containing protein [Planctomycetota bacterium]